MAYVAKRLVGLAFVLAGVSALVFAMIAALPGDPATAILGPFATPERLAELRAQLRLEGNVFERYAVWLGNLLNGDFGRSYSLDRTVDEVLAERLLPTLALAGSSLIAGTLVGLLLGSLAAARHRSWVDRTLTLAALVGISTPSFWLAMLLMLVFSVSLGWFPISGISPSHGPYVQSPLASLHHLVLPASALALVVGGVIARFMRSAMLETLSAEFIRLARAKGVREADVVYGHAFQVAFAKVLPVVGLQAGFVLGGAAYIETVFQWPGLGKLLVDAILERDLLLAQGAVLVLATCYVVVNLCTDLAQRWLDPRVRA